MDSNIIRTKAWEQEPNILIIQGTRGPYLILKYYNLNATIQLLVNIMYIAYLKTYSNWNPKQNPYLIFFKPESKLLLKILFLKKPNPKEESKSL